MAKFGEPILAIGRPQAYCPLVRPLLIAPAVARSLAALLLGSAVATGACREAPPYIDPARYALAGDPTQGSVPKLFAAALPTGEDLPDDVTADALQMGWFCFDLPTRTRTRMLPMRGDGRLRTVQDDGQGGWQVLAVDLATRQATAETALLGPDDEPGPQGTVHRMAFAPAWAATPVQDELAPTVALPTTPAAEVAWLIWQRQDDWVTLALDATHVQQFSLDSTGRQIFFIDAPADATPALWHIALSEAATAALVGPALALWAVVFDGSAAVVRAQGEAGLETQLVYADGTRRRLGPDGVAVVAVGPSLLIETATGDLLRVDASSSAWHRVGTGGRPGRLVARGGQPAVQLPEDVSVAALYWFDGGGLQRVTALGPAQWLAAVPLKGGVAAALLDRSDRQLGPAGRDVAVCVVARAVKPLVVPVR